MNKLPGIVLGTAAVLSAGLPSVHAATDSCIVPPDEVRTACGRPESHLVDLEESDVKHGPEQDVAQVVQPSVALMSGVSLSGSLGVVELTAAQPTTTVQCGEAPFPTDCSPSEPEPQHVDFEREADAFLSPQMAVREITPPPAMPFGRQAIDPNPRGPEWLYAAFAFTHPGAGMVAR